jgi:hypothetical protein
MAYNADSGTGAVNTSPATDLPETFTRPQYPYRDPPEQHMGGFYQHKDHKNDPPFRFDWRARPDTGLSYRKHPQGTHFSSLRGRKLIAAVGDLKSRRSRTGARHESGIVGAT